MCTMRRRERMEENESDIQWKVKGVWKNLEGRAKSKETKVGRKYKVDRREKEATMETQMKPMKLWETLNIYKRRLEDWNQMKNDNNN